jgi:hypothetical protein
MKYDWQLKFTQHNGTHTCVVMLSVTNKPYTQHINMGMSTIMLSEFKLPVIFPYYYYAECCNAECRGTILIALVGKALEF